MKKGLAQKLLIGKLNDQGEMNCEMEETAEIEESEVPSVPVDIMEEDLAPKQKQCYYNLIRGEFLTEETNRNKVRSDHITDEVLQRVKAALDPDRADKTESNEYAWWLRKCCAKTVPLS